MWLPLICFLLSLFVYYFLYEYYLYNCRKKVVELDFLKSLDTVQFNPTSIIYRKTLAQVKDDLRKYFYFHDVKVIFGIDFSASNEWQGRRTFNGQLLHKINANKIYNPYQKAISQLGSIFTDIFPIKAHFSCFGFGDETVKDLAFFPIVGSGEEIENHQSVLDAYLEQVKRIRLGGPTRFTPIIQKLASLGIHCKRDLTILIILTDELKISHEDPLLVESIYTLTNLPNVCLFIVGVGDGPWERMSYEEHYLRESVFKNQFQKSQNPQQAAIHSDILYDNFHFLEFNACLSKSNQHNGENYLARALLTKLPTHLKLAYKQYRKSEHITHESSNKSD